MGEKRGREGGVGDTDTSHGSCRKRKNANIYIRLNHRQIAERKRYKMRRRENKCQAPLPEEESHGVK